MTAEERREKIQAEIRAEFQRWDHIQKHGCRDPFWPDGVNINLVRNHIIYWYRQLGEYMENIQLDLFQPAGYAPEAYGLRKIPPEMDDRWMCPTGEYPNRLDRRKA